MRILFAISFIFSLGLVTPTQAELVIDNQPTRVGGLFSDTEFVDDFNQELFQRVADDLTLAEPAVIRRAGFWGFYNLNNPPAAETIRMRFYGARPGDGLPDESNIIFEESFLNPSRTATGHIVFVGIGPLEYFYEVDLSSPVSLTANTPYWLEIAQIGDIDTAFRWEFAFGDLNGQAAINPIVGDWTRTQSIVSDTAYQLSTIPEPSTAALLVLGIGLAARGKRPFPSNRRHSGGAEAKAGVGPRKYHCSAQVGDRAGKCLPINPKTGAQAGREPLQAPGRAHAQQAAQQ